MKLWLADENFPISSYRFLEAQGYDIKHIAINDSGLTDHEVIQLAIKEKRIIITFDSDFGELVFKFSYQPKGVLYFRWKTFKPKEPGQYLHKVLTQQVFEVEGFFTVIGEHQVRQRKI